MMKCPTCLGRGRTQEYGAHQVCPDCEGTGRFNAGACDRAMEQIRLRDLRERGLLNLAYAAGHMAGEVEGFAAGMAEGLVLGALGEAECAEAENEGENESRNLASDARKDASIEAPETRCPGCGNVIDPKLCSLAAPSERPPTMHCPPNCSQVGKPHVHVLGAGPVDAEDAPPFESEAGELLATTARMLGASFSSCPIKSSVCAVPEAQRIDPSVAGVPTLTVPLPSPPPSRPDLVKFMQSRFRMTDHAVALAANYVQQLLLKPLRERVERAHKGLKERYTDSAYDRVQALEEALRIIEEGE